jgi:hypothetical protein
LNYFISFIYFILPDFPFSFAHAYMHIRALQAKVAVASATASPSPVRPHSLLLWSARDLVRCTRAGYRWRG